jgi:hypothetical protein
MTAFRVEFLFEIGSASVPLEVSRETLGRSFTLSRDGMPVQITLPQQPNDFLFWRPFVPGEYRALIDWGDEGKVSLHVIRVSVNTDGEFSAAMPLEGQTMARAVEMIDRAHEVASRVVAAFVAWVRATTRMTGLSLSSEVPSLAGPVRTIEVGTGLPIRTGPSIRSVSVGRDAAGKYHLDLSDVERFIEQVNRGDEPPVAETLLADAEYYARHAISDFRRAVLMAAIACEVKVKSVLRSRATDAQRSLVDFALDNPREITITAAGGLFDKLMLATLGRSLRQDDRQLFRDVEALYTVRNRIAHSGLMPDEAEAGRVVRAARRCFTWLDSLPQSRAPEVVPQKGAQRRRRWPGWRRRT